MDIKNILKIYVSDQLDKAIGKKLKTVKYNDLTDDCDSLKLDCESLIHIIVEATLIFENEIMLSITWTSHKEWPQYVLGCFKEPQYENQSFDMTSNRFWSKFIGKKITSYEVFGYKKCEHIIQHNSFEEKIFYKNEPHLIRLNFYDSTIAFANFYYENDRVPKYYLGDDLWVFFDSDYVSKIITDFDFVRISP